MNQAANQAGENAAGEDLMKRHDQLEARLRLPSPSTFEPEVVGGLCAQLRDSLKRESWMLEALKETERSFALLEGWIGKGMVTGHRAKVMNWIGDAPEKVQAAIRVSGGEG